LQFPFPEGFKPQIVQDDLISFFEFLFLQSFIVLLLILSLYMLAYS
jgi:hypothetical protein